MNRLLVSLYLVIFAAAASWGCTSAIIGPELNPTGRPILWKHRDTSTIDNKVEYVPARDGNHAYVALFNAGDKNLREAWMGMNDVGFAVMNTASYNIKDDKVAASKMDKEGFVMTRALRTCTTVDDFAKLLETLPRPMGVEANFGVIDAYGNGAYFETNNHAYVRYDLKDAPDHMLVRTNYSHSGRKNEGYGFIREANACHLLEPYAVEHAITPEVLTEDVSRRFYHDLKKRDYTLSGEKWLVDQDFIPRYKSTATVAIEGCVPIKPGEEGNLDVAKEYVMWTGLGYPPVAQTLPVRCAADGVPVGLRGTLPAGHSPLADEAKRKRNEAFPLKAGNGDKYIDISKLYNEEGTGYAQEMIRVNHETYRKFEEERNGGSQTKE